MSVSITTVVRDATCHGGGMLNVARPLHAALHAQGRDAQFVIGIGAGEVDSVTHVVGHNGRYLRNLPAAVMQSTVHIHGIWTPFEYRAFREARRRRAHVVMSPHGALESYASNHKFVKKRLAWWLYQRHILQSADLLVVNSTQELQALRKLGLTPPIATIANGVDLDGFSTLDAVKPRERIVLFFSRIDPKKGLPDLINAWLAVADHRGYRLHIHGHGETGYVEWIRQKIVDTGRDDIVLLPPVFGAARWRVFNRASIYVLPSYSENFGITVAEALTAGLPVITTRATPWAQLSREGLGWIVDNEIGQLRDALQAAIQLEPAILDAMRATAHAYASQRFAWREIAQRYGKTYDWIAGQTATAPDWVDRV